MNTCTCSVYVFPCTSTCTYIHVLMRDERKKEASKVKQTTRQSNTAHPRQSLFLRKMSFLRWDMMYTGLQEWNITVHYCIGIGYSQTSTWHAGHPMRFETRARPSHRHSEIDLRHPPPHQTTRSSVEEEEGAHPPDPSHCREGYGGRGRVREREGEGGRGRGREREREEEGEGGRGREREGEGRVINTWLMVTARETHSPC